MKNTLSLMGIMSVFLIFGSGAMAAGQGGGGGGSGSATGASVGSQTQQQTQVQIQIPAQDKTQTQQQIQDQDKLQTQQHLQDPLQTQQQLQDQDRIQLHTQDQLHVGTGTGTQAQVQTQTQIQAQTQEQEQQSQQNATNTADIMNQATNAIQTMIQIANRNADVGDKIRTIAQTQTQSQEQLQTNLQTIQNRNGLMQFLIGPDYGTINSSNQLLEQNRAQITELNQFQAQIADPADKQALTEQVRTLEQSNTAIQNVLDSSRGGFSLFGWFVRLFTG